MTIEEAKQLAIEYLARLGPNDEEIAFYDDHCRPTQYGWILFYNSKRFIETGNMLYAFGGNGPLVIIADTREVVAVSTACNTDDGIRESNNREASGSAPTSTVARSAAAEFSLSPRARGSVRTSASDGWSSTAARLEKSLRPARSR